MAHKENSLGWAGLLPGWHCFRKRATAGFAVVCTLTLGLLTPLNVRAASPADSKDSTREQVRSDLDRYRCAGYNPIADEITYPNDIDAARARLQDPGCPNPDAASKTAPPSNKQSK
ncbi:DUF4148 domain-containing protein [Caballeronia sp. M1242]|uniref:DUF4148 domain-containing protein n=1 Tax=Caballeronia sp. M1242 TaxID=2814653 RepID=UPI0019D1F888|nr:DUF4148 domain-containing protein [Caballeronia sp. M1242]QSN63078.1 DUF4148 domain-containing protein [Caballeronia sp. M1242]